MRDFETKAIYSSYAIDSDNNGVWDFHGEQTQDMLHSLHAYPARFIPQIPRKAIEQYTCVGQTVLDPFVGGGTTLLESVIMGRNAIGIDNNEVACLISQAKTAAYSDQDFFALERLLSELDSSATDDTITPDVPTYKNMEYWFAADAIIDLGKIRTLIKRISGNAQLLAWAAFSSIIVNISYQDSDTRYSCVPYDYQSGKAFALFKSRLRNAINDAKAMRGLIIGSSIVYQKDGRNIDFIAPNSVDLIITSPPYLNAYDYHKYHRHRLQWIEGNVAFARDNEIGKHDTFTRKGATPDRYFDDMGLCFDQWKEILSDTGVIIIVIGDAIVSGQPVSVGDIFVSMFEDRGFFLENRWIRSVDVSRKSFNQKARVNQEHVLELRRAHLK